MSPSANAKSKKQQLLDKSKQFKEALSNDFSEIKEDSKTIGVAGAYVAGVLAVGYLFYKLLTSGSDDESYEPSSKEYENGIVYVNQPNNSSIFNDIMRHIALFLLGIAKEKLTDYLRNRKSSSED